jgi:ATP-dependent DNA ligase
MLEELVNDADDKRLQFSGEFNGPVRLLATENPMVEGIVSKRRSSVYQSGRTRDWLKTKTAAWRAANHDRGEMFRGRA